MLSGDRFANKEEFVNAIKTACSNACRTFRYKVNKTSKVVVVCKQSQLCHFNAVALLTDGGEAWVVGNGVNPRHQCPPLKKEKRVKSQPWTVEDISAAVYEYVQNDYNVDPKVLRQAAKSLLPGQPQISYHTAWRAREIARIACYGDPKESFRQFNAWAACMQDVDPDTVVIVDTADEKFQRCFVALGPHVRSFQYHPQLCNADGAACFSTYEGCLLSLTCPDARGCTNLLAYAWIPGAETFEHWCWFLQHCKEVYPGLDAENFPVITDQGLSTSVRATLPKAVNFACAKHRTLNINKHGFGKKAAEGYWAVAKAFTKEQYEAGLENMARLCGTPAKAAELQNYVEHGTTGLPWIMHLCSILEHALGG